LENTNTNDMNDSAILKIQRALEHINELDQLFENKRPFSYILETNVKTGHRATFARTNESVVQRVTLVCGDAVHNLRSALDHAYWEIVSPFAHTNRERKSLQFPFSETAAGLDKMVRSRLADKVSSSFFQAILDLKPHGEHDGHEHLYLLHKLDILDKHKLLIPTGDFTTLSREILVQQIPDFPMGITNCSFSQNYRDVVWKISPMSRAQRRAAKVPASGISEQIIDVPIDIVFTIPSSRRSVLPTLRELADITRTTIEIMRSA